MADYKYHTIDPLILETLNLNERRMKHILDILHGREAKPQTFTERKPRVKSMNREKSTHFNQNQFALPSINFNRNKPEFSKIQNIHHPRRSRVQSEMSGINIRLPENQQNGTQKINHKEKKAERSKDVERFPKKDEYPVFSKKLKNEMVIKDYMKGSLLRKSRSGEINSKDLYRLEVESLVGELTEIEELGSSEKKMQRLKKRYKHLHSFDKNYYLKLNQEDLLQLI